MHNRTVKELDLKISNFPVSIFIRFKGLIRWSDTYIHVIVAVIPRFLICEETSLVVNQLMPTVFSIISVKNNCISVHQLKVYEQNTKVTKADIEHQIQTEQCIQPWQLNFNVHVFLSNINKNLQSKDTLQKFQLQSCNR